MTLVFTSEFAFAISVLKNSINQVVGYTSVKSSAGKIWEDVNRKRHYNDVDTFQI